MTVFNSNMQTRTASLRIIDRQVHSGDGSEVAVEVIRNRHFVYPRGVRKTDPIIVLAWLGPGEARMN